MLNTVYLYHMHNFAMVWEKCTKFTTHNTFTIFMIPGKDKCLLCHGVLGAIHFVISKS